MRIDWSRKERKDRPILRVTMVMIERLFEGRPKDGSEKYVPRGSCFMPCERKESRCSVKIMFEDEYGRREGNATNEVISSGISLLLVSH